MPDGKVLNKDGAILISFKFTGQDLGSVGDGELDGLNDTLNRMALELTDGWMIHLDDIRIPSTSYLDRSEFPCAAAQLIDDERREQFETEGNYYENMQVLTFVWKFPVEMIKVNKSIYMQNVEDTDKYENLPSLIAQFEEKVGRCIDTLDTYMNFEQLNAEDMLSFLNMCITGKLKPMQVPPVDMFLDTYLASEELVCGLAPRIGDKHIKILSIMGTKLSKTYQGILEALSTYPLVYRVSNRFIALSTETAEVELKRYRKQWNNKITGFKGIVLEALMNKPTKNIDEHAGLMKDEVKDAIMLNTSGSVRFGYWSCQIVLMSEDLEMLNIALKDFRSFLDSLGFSSLVESLNAVDAYFGTIPGHGSCNVRRVFLNSRQLAHVLPLSTLWTGDKRVTKGYLPKNAPVCFVAKANGATPFWFNIDNNDLGHTIAFGIPGTGKSTYLQFALSQFMRYKNAKIFLFDKDLSHYGWTQAMGGKYYNIGEDMSIGFAPFKNLETPSQRNAAILFVETLCQLQGVTITPIESDYIAKAVDSLATTDIDADRSLSALSTYADNSIKQALRFYTKAGVFDMLDSKTDSISDGYLHAFEMGWLIGQDKKYYVPVMMHQMNSITKFLEESKTKCPTVIVLEEAWLYLDHELFSKFIIDWMKTLRKFNARLWLVTQSLSDLYDPANGALRASTAAILDNCKTMLFLPNPGMEKETEKLYSKIGLTDRQIEIVKSAKPKRDYYLVRPPLDTDKESINLNIS